METHVSSTTADVPDTQEVIGSHGNVEIVVAVEKVDEDTQQKADSNSQDNAQAVMEGSSPPCSQSTKTDGVHKSPRKQEALLPLTSKEINKTALSPIKLLSTKQPTTQTNANETQTAQSKLSAKQTTAVTQNTPEKEPPAPADVDSTSPKDIAMDVTSDEVDNKNDSTLNIDIDPSNESQSENIGDAEKEHNKSISRELKSLINSAKESKIISECTKLTSKTRKSARAAQDTSSTNMNNTPEADHIQGNRRSSSNSQKSNSSEKSERVGKRSMRSQNPEFVYKVRKFLNSVTGKFQKDADSDESAASDEETVAPKIKENATDSSPSIAKNRSPTQEQVQSKVDEKCNKLRSDPYCWRCHWSIDMNDGEKTPQPSLKCTVCPRAFHYRCLTGSEKNKISSVKNWVCPECMTVLHAESSDTRSLAMKKTTLGMLCELLKYALQRMTEVAGSEPFLQSVDRSVFPDYDKYVVHPMDLALMREHIDEGLYGSTEAFLADAHWILHNSIIFNTLQSKLTTTARALVRSCRAEMGEIEACPECYAAAHARRATWFTDVCSTPHLLLWAKLKGFPYWPAKAMTVSHAGLVDVRFFGAHDRAWVPARDCYLYCERDPNNFRTKRQDMVEAMQEAEQHIRNISRKYDKFAYAPYRTTFEASKLEEALKYMIPSFDGQVRSPVRERRSKTPARALKSRSNSKGSKDDSNAGDAVSDSEQMDTESSKTEEAVKNEGKEGTVPVEKPQVGTRKRARSETKGPVESSPKEKRRLVDTPGKEPAPKNTDSPVVSSSKEVAPAPAPAPTPREPGDAADEPRDLDAGPPPSDKTEATPKPNKIPKTNSVPASNKTPVRSDTPKNNDKDKSTQPAEKPVPPNQRISRSNKPNNVETIELDENTPTTTTSNKTPASPVTITAKTPNKISSKESVTITKVNDKEKSSESAVLIKINDKSNKDASLTITVNAKDKVTEAATLTKITDIVKQTHNQNKIKDTETETATPNKDSGKEKVTTATPNKTAAKATPSTKNIGSEKTNKDGPIAPSSTTNKTASDSNVSNNTGKINAKQDKPADKLTDTSAEGKKIAEKEKSAPVKNAFSPKPGTSKVIKATKDRIQYDDDTNLAVVARKVPKTSSNSEVSAGAAASGGKASAASPAADAASAPAAPPATRSKTAPITVEVNPDSSIFTPTSTDNVRNMKDAVNKLQKLRSGFDPPANSQVGKVGVRAFARMTSPPEKQAKSNDVVVEIKSEPMDYEDCDAPQETSTVLESLRPRPIAPVVSAPNLREVRISKVISVPAAAKKSPKPPDVRPRAKKTFPQPKKPDDGRSELTNKNSMVYIPIQPPISQSPVRGALKAANSATAAPPRTPTLFPTTSVKSVSAMAPPLLPMAPPPPPPATTATATSGVAGALLAPAFPAVPTTVHTVPLITSVNGQWTFSLQPVMSVGAGETITSATVNGVSERASPAAIAPAPAPPAATATQPPALVPTGAPVNPPPAPPASGATASPASELPPPPQLQQRPALQHPLSAGTEIGELTAPSSAGPLTAKLNHNSLKLAEFFRHLLEESLVQVEEPAAETAALRLQLEQERWRYQHELAELRRTNEVALVEVRAAMDKEKTRAVAEARRLAHQELEAAVKNAKSKQWCANCSQEAQFYCCWNTSYCDYPCQRAHWGQHYAHCTQQRTNASSPPTVTAKSSTNTRTLNSEQAQNKFPVAVSAADEGNAHLSTKSAGAAQQAALPTHAAPLLANKQLINNDDNAAKRVVSSGGFLIVGAAAAAAAGAARARRD
ncbi:protein kinase C-binding protein 1-like [Leguminivora glycinivorella]|uniref:protein kinase C-binding protein 1-like n=1 Tax=Leguminivora glycinivorella TaxID=1035111 RepID=UPI0020103957|nr:protein kinase C-binding protein 1-like [Leguminivora glycinivorella]